MEDPPEVLEPGEGVEEPPRGACLTACNEEERCVFVLGRVGSNGTYRCRRAMRNRVHITGVVEGSQQSKVRAFFNVCLQAVTKGAGARDRGEGSRAPRGGRTD